MTEEQQKDRKKKEERRKKKEDESGHSYTCACTQVKSHCTEPLTQGFDFMRNRLEASSGEGKGREWCAKTTRAGEQTGLRMISHQKWH